MSTLSQQERTERRPPDPEEGYRRLEESYVRALGPCEATRRLRRRWGKTRTWMHVFGNLKRYAQWLRSTGRMRAGGLDALVEENQRNLQSPDVKVRIKQYEWADEYLNEELVRRGLMDNSRKQACFSISAFYKANFSPLAAELKDALDETLELTPKP